MESRTGAGRAVLVRTILLYHKGGRRWSAHPAHARALARHCQRLVEGAAPSRHPRDTVRMRPFVNPSVWVAASKRE